MRGARRSPSPQVAAGAALLFGQYPSLTAAQVATLLTRCGRRRLGRDRLRRVRRRAAMRSRGWGRLDIAGALAAVRAGRVPAADAFEPNDDAGARAATLWSRASRTIRATADYWDDQHGRLPRPRSARGRKLTAKVTGPRGLTPRPLAARDGTGGCAGALALVASPPHSRTAGVRRRRCATGRRRTRPAGSSSRSR